MKKLGFVVVVGALLVMQSPSASGRWRTPITVIDHLPDAWRGSLDVALENYRVSATVKRGRNDTAFAQRCPFKDDVIRFCAAEYPEGTWKKDPWDGWTWVDYRYRDGRAIGYDAVRVEINATRVNTDEYRAYMVCHELGHALGLRHSDDPESCMSYSGYPYPSQEDIEALR